MTTACRSVGGGVVHSRDDGGVVIIVIAVVVSSPFPSLTTTPLKPHSTPNQALPKGPPAVSNKPREAAHDLSPDMSRAKSVGAMPKVSVTSEPTSEWRADVPFA